MLLIPLLQIYSISTFGRYKVCVHSVYRPWLLSYRHVIACVKLISAIYTTSPSISYHVVLQSSPSSLLSPSRLGFSLGEN